MKKIRIALLSIIIIFVLLPNSLNAAIQTVIAIDGTAEMRELDTNNSATLLTNLFTEFCTPGDTLSVLEFSGSYTSKPFSLELKSSLDRERISGVLDLIKGTGVYSDPNEALDSALEAFRNMELTYPAVVLITDGSIGFHHEDKRYSSKEILAMLKSKPSEDEVEKIKSELREKGLNRLFNEIVPQLKEKGIKVFVLVPGSSGDVEVYKRLCEETGGNAFFAKDLQESIIAITNIYAEISEHKVIKRTIQPFAGTRYKKISIHTGTQIVTFFYLIKPTDDLKKIFLYTPDDREIDLDNPPVTIRLFENKFLQGVQLMNPSPGIWRFRLQGESKDGVSIYRVALFDFKMSIDEIVSASLNTPTTVSAHFQQNGEVVSFPIFKAARIKGKYFQEENPEDIKEFTLRDDGATPDKIAGDGIFSTSISPTDLGEHKVNLTAKSPLFIRKISDFKFFVSPKLELKFRTSSLNLGIRKQGKGFSVDVDISNSEVDTPVDLTLSIRDPLGRPSKEIITRQNYVTLSPEDKTITISFALSGKAKPGILSGNIFFMPEKAKPGAKPFSLPFSLTVKAKTIFERLSTWIVVLLAIGGLGQFSRMARMLS